MNPAAATAIASGVKNTSPAFQVIAGLSIATLVGAAVWVGTAPLRAANQAANAANDLINGSKEEKAKAEKLEKTSLSSAFNPNYYKSIGGHCNWNATAAEKYAKQVYDSNGYFNDNEEKLYDVFNRSRSFAHVSKIADYFSRKYNEDMYQFIVNFTSVSERAVIAKILESKQAKVQC